MADQGFLVEIAFGELMAFAAQEREQCCERLMANESAALAVGGGSELLGGLGGRRLGLMGLRISSLRAVAVVAISLWMAVLACFMGCVLPALAGGGSQRAASSQNAVGPGQPEPGADPMAGMENCPHHSGGKSDGRPADGKSAPGRMSCCPLEVTVATKPDFSAVAIAPAQEFVLARGFHLPTVPFSSSVEVIPAVHHSGRDTLLKIRLLRI